MAGDDDIFWTNLGELNMQHIIARRKTSGDRHKSECARKTEAKWSAWLDKAEGPPPRTRLIVIDSLSEGD